MDIRLLLVKAITLLYQESLLPNGTSSTGMIRQALELVRTPDMPADVMTERNAVVHLRSTVMWMLTNNDSQTYDRNALLQRIRLNVEGDDRLYAVIEQGIVENIDEDSLRSSTNMLRNTIRGEVAKQQMKEVLKKASQQASFRENEIEDWEGFRQKQLQALLAIDIGGDVRTDPTFVQNIDFNDRSSVHQAFHDMQQMLSNQGILRFPWQRLNQMFGEAEGSRRGEWLLFNALVHNYKSGTLVDLFTGVCLFNDPFLFDPTRKPAIILYSTEDSAQIIIQKIYTILKQRELGIAIKARQIDIDEATDYVISSLQARGWNVFIHQVRPSTMTFTKYVSHMEDYKARGYEIVAVVCDYYAMFNREGCNAGSTGDDIQDMHRRGREYTNANRITHITAHQLSTEAKQLARQKDDFIFDLPGKGFYQGCRKLDDEVDFECYINKRIMPNGAFLEFLWGKHRKVGPTAEEHKYFALKFLESPMYGIDYDFDKEDSSFKVPGGKPNIEGGEKAWFDLEE